MRFPWGDINRYLQNKYDLLICSASYEERCLSFISHCPANKMKMALVCHCEEYHDYIVENLTSLINVLTEKKIEYSEVVLSHKNPIKSVDAIVNRLNELLLKKHLNSVLIDITAFTHEMVLILMRVFYDLYPDIHISFAYSNAGDYDPQTSETESGTSAKWLSKGVSDLRSVIGYPGNLQPTSHTHLLIVVGYEYDRALSIISELEPSSLSLAFGRSDSITTESKPSNKHYGAIEHFNELTSTALAYFPEDKFFNFDISCNDPVKTNEEIKAHLCSIGIDRKQHNIVLFALNNKPSTLGVGLFGIDNEDVQLCYAPALVYNYENYSTPGNYCYIYKDLLNK